LVREIQGGGSTTQVQHQLDLSRCLSLVLTSAESPMVTPRFVTFELAYGKLQVTNFAQTATGAQGTKVVNTFDYVQNQKT
jgi:hypothetical protein